MATRRRKADADELPARLPTPPGMIPTGGVFGAPVAAPLSATDERRDREWEDLVSEIGTDGRITVWHIVDGKSQYAGQMTPDTFSLDALLDTFGGGEKSLVFYQGKSKVDTLRVMLDSSVPPKSPRSARQPGAAAPSSGLGDMSALFSAMAQSQMSSIQMMQGMMAMSQQSSAQMLSAVTTMLTARPEKDPTELALKIAEVFKPAPAQDATTLFTIFEKGMNVAAKLQGGDSEDDTLKLAGKGLEIVGEIVKNNAAQRSHNGHGAAPSPSRALAAPVGAGSVGGRNGGVGGGGHPDIGGHGAGPQGSAGGPGSVAASENANTHGDGMGDVVSRGRPWVASARPWATMLLMAVGNFAPSTVASMMADRFDDAAFSDLLDDVDATTPEDFVARVPGYFGLAPFNDTTITWFLSLVQEVRAMVDDGSDDENGDEPDAATVDVATDVHAE